MIKNTGSKKADIQNTWKIRKIKQLTTGISKQRWKRTTVHHETRIHQLRKVDDLLLKLTWYVRLNKTSARRRFEVMQNVMVTGTGTLVGRGEQHSHYPPLCHQCSPSQVASHWATDTEILTKLNGNHHSDQISEKRRLYCIFATQ